MNYLHMDIINEHRERIGELQDIVNDHHERSEELRKGFLEITARLKKLE